MKTFKTTLPLAALAVFMSLGPASETQAQQVFDSGTPPVTATVAWNATHLTMQSPPAVPGLNNTITLVHTGGGTARNRNYCGKHVDMNGRTYGGGLRYPVVLNGSTVRMPVEICGDWAVGKTFMVTWEGNKRTPRTAATANRGDGSPTFGTVFLTSFGTASNCTNNLGTQIGSGPQGSYMGSTSCWTRVTITN